jgi:hypothetical protein
MSSNSAAPPADSRHDDLVGDQRPRILHAPDAPTSAGRECIELAAHAGLILDPWQQLILDVGLREDTSGKWAAFEVGMVVSRQNGKGSVFEARELGGLFLFGERLIIHTAHEFKTAQEAFNRVLALITNADDLRRRVKRVRTSHGEEGIELLTGQRLRFLARSNGSGRGFSGDCVILDEAMILGDDAMAALLPTLSARPNPQVWYGASAGIGAPSVQLGRVRERGVAGTDPSLAYMEWSANLCTDECGRGCTEHDDPDDPRTWARANPGLGIRITTDFIARERRALSDPAFRRERLGQGDYPTETQAWEVISESAWSAVADPHSRALDPVALAVDVSPDRSTTSIAIAGRREDDLVGVELIDYRPGTGWTIERVTDLVARWSPCAVVIDAAGPAGSLIAALSAEGVEVVTPSAREVAQACGQFHDAVVDTRTLRHRDQAPLTAAVSGARRRDLGGAWAWGRKGLSVDISPLVAVTLAAWGHATRAHVRTEVVLDGSLMA